MIQHFQNSSCSFKWNWSWKYSFSISRENSNLTKQYLHVVMNTSQFTQVFVGKLHKMLNVSINEVGQQESAAM